MINFLIKYEYTLTLFSKKKNTPLSFLQLLAVLKRLSVGYSYVVFISCHLPPLEITICQLFIIMMLTRYMHHEQHIVIDQTEPQHSNDVLINSIHCS